MNAYKFKVNIPPFVQKDGKNYVEDPMITTMVNFGIVFDSAAYANMLAAERKETTAIEVADDFDAAKPLKTYENYGEGTLSVYADLDHFLYANAQSAVTGNVLLLASNKSEYIANGEIESFEFEGKLACSPDNQMELIRTFDVDTDIFEDVKNETLFDYVKTNYLPKYAVIDDAHVADEDDNDDEHQTNKEELEPGETGGDREDKGPEEPEPEPEPEPEEEKEPTGESKTEDEVKEPETGDTDTTEETDK